MKRGVYLLPLIMVLFFGLNFQLTYSSSNYETDYTLIDCINGNDTTGESFNSTKPYQTLKNGIEKTIEYINTNINVSGNEQTASGKMLTIKVNCSLMPNGQTQIDLNFDGKTYKNELLIEGIGDNGLVINDIYFYLPNGKGNITIKNGKFLSNENKGYYFLSQNISWDGNYYSYGVKIEDSHIKIKHGKQFGINQDYGRWEFGYWRVSGYYYNNQQYIKNSTLEIELNGNYNFWLPVIIKDSKINFLNTIPNQIYDISFLEKGDIKNNLDFDFFTLISNEIDLGGNNFFTEDKYNIAFINNKITNFNDFKFGANNSDIKEAVFLNNQIDNNNITLDISNTKNTYNNVFSGNFTNTNDPYNLKKNYKSDNIGPKGLGWVYRKLFTSNMFKLNYTSSSLYKEITGQEIPEQGDSVYLFFQ